MVRGIQGADVHHSKGEDRIWKWIISLPALVSDPGLATPDETLAEERAVGRLEISSRPTYPESCGDTEIVKLREIDLQKARDGLSAKESKLLCSKPDPHDQTPVESKCSKRRFSQTWESQPSSCEQGLLLIRRNAYELDSISPDDEVARNTDLRASPESPLPSLSQSSWGGCGMPWKHSSHGAAFEIVQNTEERISPESPLPSVSQSSSQDQIEPYEHNSNESAIGLTQGPDIRAIPESPLPEVSQSSPQDSTRWPASSDGNLEDHLERTLAHQSTPYKYENYDNVP